MKKWHEIGKELRRYLNPETFPVAVKFLERTADIPEKTRFPLKDLGVKLAHCQVSAMVRKYGWTMAVTPDDLGCGISGHTHGWMPADREGAVDFLTRMNYAADEAAAVRMFESFRTLEPGKCGAVVYSPLEWTKVPPDVVLIYLNPARLMRCLHGSTCRGGEPVASSFSGRAASCTEGAIAAFLDQAPKVVAPGNGDRVWAGAQDHEMIYAVPASHLETMIQGLADTHARGVRYPVPTYLRFQPEVAFSLPLLDVFKKAGKTKGPGG